MEKRLDQKVLNLGEKLEVITVTKYDPNYMCIIFRWAELVPFFFYPGGGLKKN